MSDCEHSYKYAGVRFAHGARNRPGSGAKQRYYAHTYFCEKCLDHRYERISDDANSYQDVRYDASPGDRKKIVPEHDQQDRRF